MVWNRCFEIHLLSNRKHSSSQSLTNYEYSVFPRMKRMTRQTFPIPIVSRCSHYLLSPNFNSLVPFTLTVTYVFYFCKVKSVRSVEAANVPHPCICTCTRGNSYPLYILVIVCSLWYNYILKARNLGNVWHYRKAAKFLVHTYGNDPLIKILASCFCT